MSRLLLAPFAFLALAATASAAERPRATLFTPAQSLDEMKHLVQVVIRAPNISAARVAFDVDAATYNVQTTQLENGLTLRVTSNDSDAAVTNANIDVNGKTEKDAKIISLVATTKDGADLVAFNTDGEELSVSVTGKDGKTETFTTTTLVANTGTGSAAGRSEAKTETKTEAKTDGKKTGDIALYDSKGGDDQGSEQVGSGDILTQLSNDMSTDAVNTNTNDTSPNQTSVSGENP